MALRITTDLRVYFSADNPQLAALEELEEKYRQNDSLMFLVVAAEGDIFTAKHLQLIRDLTKAGWQSPFAQRVSSLANYQHTHSDGDTLITEPLVSDETVLDSERIAYIKSLAATEPGIETFLVAADGSLATVNVLLSVPGSDASATEAVVSFGRELARQKSAQYGITVLVAGSATNSVTLGEAVEDDVASLVGLSFGLITLLMIVLMRSVFATLLVVLVIGCSVAATMGSFGWLGYLLSPTAGFVPSVVMTIAVADCVHVLVSYFVELGHGRDKMAAIRESLRINLSPVFITSLTTSMGVLSLNLSDSPPYRDLGNMVALGVFFAFLLSLTLLPAALALLPTPQRSAKATQQIPVDRLAAWVIDNQRRLLLFGTVALVIIGSFAARNQLTERWHEYFSESFEIRRAVDLVDQHMGGIHRFYYDLETGQVDGIVDPGYLRTLDLFEQWFLQQSGVSAVMGLHTTVKSLNKALNYDDPEFFTLPMSSQAVAQYLLLYELSLPLGAGLDNVMDQDRSASRVTVVLEKTDSESLLQIDTAAQAWLMDNGGDIKARPGTGLDLVFAHITHRNIRGLLWGTLLALAGISVLLMVVLRSIRLGFISLLPNLAPAALAYGLWGLVVGHIDLALSVVICMSLGIVVDDTVHFLSKYLRARRERALTASQGIHYAFRTVGMALATTSMVLVLGFSLLLASEFTPTRETGSLLAITLALALVVDFLLLPPLLLVADRLWPEVEEAT